MKVETDKFRVPATTGVQQRGGVRAGDVLGGIHLPSL